MNDWKRIGDRIYQIMETIRARQASFTEEAQCQGVNLNQLTASAIAGMLMEEIEGPRTTRPRRPPLAGKTGRKRRTSL